MCGCGTETALGTEPPSSLCQNYVLVHSIRKASTLLCVAGHSTNRIMTQSSFRRRRVVASSRRDPPTCAPFRGALFRRSRPPERDSVSDSRMPRCRSPGCSLTSEELLPGPARLVDEDSLEESRSVCWTQAHAIEVSSRVQLWGHRRLRLVPWAVPTRTWRKTRPELEEIKIERFASKSSDFEGGQVSEVILELVAGSFDAVRLVGWPRSRFWR